MGLFNSMANYAHKSELRESQGRDHVRRDHPRGCRTADGAATGSSPTRIASRWGSSCPTIR